MSDEESQAASNTTEHSMMANAMGSAIAGIVGRLFTHPLDTGKARLQAVYGTGGNPYRGVSHVLWQTWSTEGVRGLYRGLGAVLIGGTPGTVLYLCTYEKVKESLQERRGGGGGEDFVVHFASGMLAETIACIVYVPVDVIKERMQVQQSSSTGYKNGWDAVRQIAKTEGLRGIYRGYGATLASFGPFSALYFVFYEKTKHWSRQYQTGRTNASSWELDKVELPFTSVVLCSATSGALASWITSPLDLAKLRLQISRQQQSSSSYRGGVVDCLQQAYRSGGGGMSGGIRALFRGAGARVIHFAPATTITMTCFETCRSLASKFV